MALWFKLKDSVTRVAVLRFLSIAVLLGEYFFSPCHCLPIDKDVTANEPWWCQPCKYIHKTRHSRGINDPIKTQFEIAINNYETRISKYIKQLHTKLQIGNMTKKQFRKNNWLPRKKFFKKLRKNDEKILPELHFQVQIYAVTIQRLLDMEIPQQDASFDFTHRTNILNLVKSDINLLRCEIEQEIAEKQLEPPEKVPEDKIDKKKIPSAVDNLPNGLIKDYSILKDYYNFLKKCNNKIFGKIKKNRKNNKQAKNDKPKNKRTSKNDINQKSEKS